MKTLFSKDKKVLVSACLLGEPCRWHGRRVGVSSFVKRYLLENLDVELIQVCPEQLGGLPTPRPPCKRRGSRVWETCPEKENRPMVTGAERTREFHAGAKLTLEIARANNCKLAILTKWSPSCDAGGITGRLLFDSGIAIFNC